MPFKSSNMDKIVEHNTSHRLFQHFTLESECFITQLNNWVIDAITFIRLSYDMASDKVCNLEKVPAHEFCAITTYMAYTKKTVLEVIWRHTVGNPALCSQRTTSGACLPQLSWLTSLQWWQWCGQCEVYNKSSIKYRSYTYTEAAQTSASPGKNCVCTGAKLWFGVQRSKLRIWD